MKRFLIALVAFGMVSTALYAGQGDASVAGGGDEAAIFVSDTAGADAVSPAPVGEDSRQAFENSPKWVLDANGGAQVFFGRNDEMMGFGDRIAPVAGISLRRSLTPAIALGLEMSGNQFKGIYYPGVDHYFNTDTRYANDEYIMYEQKGWYMTGLLNFYVDMCGWIGGYNIDRVSNFIPYVGAGWAFGLGDNKSASSPVMNLGLLYDIRISKGFSVNINVRGSLLRAGFGGEMCDEHLFHGSAGISAGVAYHFGK